MRGMNILPLVRVLLAMAVAVTAFAQDRVVFLYPAKDDKVEAADLKLKAYLQKTAGIQFDEERRFTYEEAIRDVLKFQKSRKPYVARLTPYAYVAAELQGAEFEVLATYLSKATNTVTYHSWLVVRKDADGKLFQAEKPTTRDVLDYLDRSKPRRKFIYHDKFSTSSYFVPSIFFRTNRIFDTPLQAPGSLHPITVSDELKDKKSSDLIMMVANETDGADIAAVWDGTIKSFMNDEKNSAVAERLRFIELPNELPNDLLVCSKELPEKQKEALRAAIGSMNGCKSPDLDFGEDFACWIDINHRDSVNAEKALVELRRDAIAQPAPVTVKASVVVDSAEKIDLATKRKYGAYLAAVRRALRFAGTEFVLHEDKIHDQTPDFEWKIKPVHDGSIILSSEMNELVNEVEKQTFHISFTDVEEDLPKRIETIIHTRLNRIRYIWPYSATKPLILRDVNFALDTDKPLRARYITWTYPERNKFVPQGEEVELRLDPKDKSDEYKFVIESTSLPAKPALNPMSNSAWRVVLERPDPERPLFRNLTVALVLLFVLAAVAAVFDWRRSSRAARAPRSSDAQVSVPPSQALRPAE